MTKIKLNWYVLAGLFAIVSYPFAANLLSQQFSVYKIHMGNPATYIVVFFLTGLFTQKWAVKKWGKMDYRGWSILVFALMALTYILVKGFGYKFFNWL